MMLDPDVLLPPDLVNVPDRCQLRVALLCRELELAEVEGSRKWHQSVVTALVRTLRQLRSDGILTPERHVIALTILRYHTAQTSFDL